MTDKDLALQLKKWAQNNTKPEDQDQLINDMSALIKAHRESYAEEKYTEGMNDFERSVISDMQKYQQECARNPKKELYSDHLAMTIEYWKANPFPKPTIKHN